MNTTENQVNEIAKELVSLCRAGKFEEAQAKFYAPDIVSVEAVEMPNMPREVKGIAAVRQKTKMWRDNAVVHSMSVSEPFVSQDQFAVVFTMDMTCTVTGERKNASELGVYTVANGKVAREVFLRALGE